MFKSMIPWLAALLLASSPSTTALVISRQQQTDPAPCQSLGPDGPFQIDAFCVDPTYGKPIITSESDVDLPIPHHRVSGIFDNTTITFNIYLPSRIEFQNRFFQYIYPLATGEALDAEIQFAADQKGYQVAVKGALGYRQDAAAAKFARQVAAKYYNLANASAIYGYGYGGSGGSFQTIGAVENTRDVWQGMVPYIQAIPTSIPNSVASLAFCALVLGDKGPLIAEAVLPGGDQNPEKSLNDFEKTTYRECTALGYPPRQWEIIKWNYDGGLLLNFYPSIYNIDKGYADAFWNTPDYAGTEDSDLGRFMRERRRVGNITLENIQRDANGSPTSLSLKSVPEGLSLLGADFSIIDGSNNVIARMNTLGLDESNKRFNLSLTPSLNSSAFDLAGARFQFDNSKYIAAHLYHRHQLPIRPGFTIYDQYRQGGVSQGQPLYPQRTPLIGPLIAASPSGRGSHTGLLRAKTIVVQNLLDINSPPWNALWYKGQVQRAMGSDAARANYRLWFTDNADHPEGPIKPSSQNRLIQYDGILYHALYHMSRWVEQGIEPPETTYSEIDGQVSVPRTADERGGVQPVVELTVGNKKDKSINVACGQTVDLAGKVQVPRGLGGIIKVEWDYKGTGSFVPVNVDKAKKTLNIRSQHTYAQKGTYFATLRAASVYDGNLSNNFSNAYNLDRARIVVSC